MNDKFELIFGYEIDRIKNEKIKQFAIKFDSLKDTDCGKLREILDSGKSDIEKVLVLFSMGLESKLEDFFTVFMPEKGKFTVEPSKIILDGPIGDVDCKIFEYIENVRILPKYLNNIENIQMRFKNLKRINITQIPVVKRDVGNIKNIIESSKYMKSIVMVPFFEAEELREEIARLGLDDKLFLSDDGICLVNSEKLEDREYSPQDIKVNVRDIEKIGIEKLANCGERVSLIIRDASELSIDQIKEYQNAGIDIKDIKIFSGRGNSEVNKPYLVEEYCAIRSRLDELVEGISLDLPEKQRFAEVYSRICKNIVYDTVAVYPKTKEEEEYSKLQEKNCRNLRNGLLEGKCVCSGYADILRNALAMVNIDCLQISGLVIDREVKKSKYKKEKFEDLQVYKEDGDKVILTEGHAWNKVKLDGVWYNVDATWDSSFLRQGQNPIHCLKTDKEVTENERKVDFDGPECNQKVDIKEIEELFGIKHLYIGKMKVPNTQDIIATIKGVGEMYVDIGVGIRNGFASIREKLADMLSKKKRLEINSPLNTQNKESNNSWDLGHWGIEQVEFSKQTKNIHLKENKREVEDKDKEVEIK